MYKLGILTSLYDDDAPELLKTLDDAISDGIIQAEVPFVFCDKREDDTRIEGRIRKVRELRHINKLVFLPPEDVDANMYREARQSRNALMQQQFRQRYDNTAMEQLQGVDSLLNVGYMRIIGTDMCNALTIVNLHPALPEIGPIGMWPKVMEEQAARPLPYLLASRDLERHLTDTMNISRLKSGGMLHVVTEETDRGPVISWYEFPLVTERLKELWFQVVREAKQIEYEGLNKSPSFADLKREIRYEQLKGEHPLLVLTYQSLTKGDWEIRDRRLLVGGIEQPSGYCLNREIGNYLTSRGIGTVIR